MVVGYCRDLPAPALGVQHQHALGTGHGGAGAETTVHRNQGDECTAWTELCDPAIESGDIIGDLGMDRADDRHRRDFPYAIAASGTL